MWTSRDRFFQICLKEFKVLFVVYKAKNINIDLSHKNQVDLNVSNELKFKATNDQVPRCDFHVILC